MQMQVENMLSYQHSKLACRLLAFHVELTHGWSWACQFQETIRSRYDNYASMHGVNILRLRSLLKNYNRNDHIRVKVKVVIGSIKSTKIILLLYFQVKFELCTYRCDNNYCIRKPSLCEVRYAFDHFIYPHTRRGISVCKFTLQQRQSSSQWTDGGVTVVAIKFRL